MGSITASGNSFNSITIAGSATGQAVTLTSSGGDSVIPIDIVAKGAGATRFLGASTEGGGNNASIAGNTTGNDVGFSASSTSIDTNVNVQVNGKGTGAVKLAAQAANANFVQVAGATAGNNPTISVLGTDTNPGLNIVPKGTGPLQVQTPAGFNEFAVLGPIAGATNYVQVQAFNAGSAPGISVQGTDTNITLQLVPKGTGSVALTNSLGNFVLQTNGTTATQANYILASSATTTNPPSISAVGSDANVNLKLAGKGTGSVAVGAGGGLTGLVACSTAVSAGINNVETVLQSFPLVAGATLKAGSKVRITMEGTCVATVSNTSTFTIRAGTAGTTSDASVMAITTVGSGTSGAATAFKAVFEFNVRTLGASGTAAGSLYLVSHSPTAGILGAQGWDVQAATSATLATTTATFLSITYVTGATTTTSTFQDVSIEVYS